MGVSVMVVAGGGVSVFWLQLEAGIITKTSITITTAATEEVALCPFFALGDNIIFIFALLLFCAKTELEDLCDG